jgi:hypothetical protein
VLNITCSAQLCEFFIDSPPDTQRKERQRAGQGEMERKRKMGCCVLLSAVDNHLSPTLRAISLAHGQGYQD